MELSAGLLIIFNNKVLLAKPTKGTKNMWGIPKGKVEKGEDHISTARRETKEEIGIDVDIKNIDPTPHIINYTNKKTKQNYKRVIYYVCKITNISDIGLESEKIPNEQLQKREISKAKFFTVEEALDKVFWRQKEVLDYIQSVEKINEAK